MRASASANKEASGPDCGSTAPTWMACGDTPGSGFVQVAGAAIGPVDDEEPHAADNAATTPPAAATPGACRWCTGTSPRASDWRPPPSNVTQLTWLCTLSDNSS